MKKRRKYYSGALYTKNNVNSLEQKNSKESASKAEFADESKHTDSITNSTFFSTKSNGII